MQIKKIVAAGLAIAGLAFGLARAADTISGAGATFPYPIYAKWASSYQEIEGVRLNYQSIGSGGGIAQIKAGTVTFGATDAPLSGEALDEAGLVQWPMIMGGLVPVVNIEGIAPGELILEGDVLADIYLGRIRKWNDPRLGKMNPGLDLPDKAIAVIHRSDGSGTTFNFTYYLSAISSAWEEEVGTAKAVYWPTGLGAKGNEGVAGNVRQTANSIGYVEYAYAVQNDMIHARMINREGRVVSPAAESFAAAAANADWNGTPGYAVILANQPGEESWPMTAASFILMPTTPKDTEAAAAALRFFDWCFEEGDDMAHGLHYVPMPDSVVTGIKVMWSKAITSPDGTPVYGGSQ